VADRPPQVAPAVVAAKVARERAFWDRNADAYRRRGWVMLGHDRVTFDIGFLASVAMPAGPLDLMPITARFDYTDFDLEPPSVRFIDPRTGEDRMPATRALMPTPDGPRDLVLNDHPVYRRPFLCVPGTREYHEHPQHSGDLWLLHRRNDAGRLAPLCDLIWRTMSDNVVGLNVGVQALPAPVGYQVQLGVLQGDRQQLANAPVVGAPPVGGG
jgi:hypothetical protein